jgi:hypothetical protein
MQQFLRSNMEQWFSTDFKQMSQNQPVLRIASVPVLEHIVP